ncbi:type 1 glutamine amidotransferase [Streptomyces sp. NPDC005728]|uniref:type 1 glutamine amidotransferase n=1 Tax=Streptomyces sp. NPDC005728 TaxID=3157054 RepID=UPI0033D8B06C
MRALIIKHDHLSTPGHVGERLAQRGHVLDEFLVVPEERFTDPGIGCTFPEAEEFDLVVALGAPWSVDHTDLIGPWIAPELTLLESAHARGIPVLGICFGGQALSTALGGRVERSPRFELGWNSIHHPELTPETLAAWLTHGGGTGHPCCGRARTPGNICERMLPLRSGVLVVTPPRVRALGERAQVQALARGGALQWRGSTDVTRPRLSWRGNDTPGGGEEGGSCCYPYRSQKSRGASTIWESATVRAFSRVKTSTAPRRPSHLR